MVPVGRWFVEEKDLEAADGFHKAAKAVNVNVLEMNDNFDNEEVVHVSIIQENQTYAI